MNNKINFILPLDNNYNIKPNSISKTHIDYMDNIHVSNKLGGKKINSKIYEKMCDKNTKGLLKGGNKKIITNLNKIISITNTNVYQKGGAASVPSKLSVLVDSKGDVDGGGMPRRILFLIIFNSKPYYLKCAPFNNIVIYNNFKELPDKQSRKKYIDELPFSEPIIGQYLYEAKMYDTVLKQLESINKQSNVVKIHDYGLINTNEPSFDIYIDDSKIGIDNIGLTKERLGTCNTDHILNDKDEIMPLQQDKILMKLTKQFNYRQRYFSYIITECTDGYITFGDFLNNKEHYEPYIFKQKINAYIQKTIELLNFLKTSINFSHNDLHSGNLLVNESNDSVKLYDFDLSTCEHGDRLTVSAFDDTYLLEFNWLKTICAKYKYPIPEHFTQMLYTYDLYRLMVEPFLSNKHLLPDFYLQLGTTHVTTPLTTILETIIYKNQTSIMKDLNKYDCMDKRIGRLYGIKSQGDPWCMMKILSWLIFGGNKLIPLNIERDYLVDSDNQPDNISLSPATPPNLWEYEHISTPTPPPKTGKKKPEPVHKAIPNNRKGVTQLLRENVFIPYYLSGRSYCAGDKCDSEYTPAHTGWQGETCHVCGHFFQEGDEFRAGIGFNSLYHVNCELAKKKRMEKNRKAKVGHAGGNQKNKTSKKKRTIKTKKTINRYC